MYFLATVFISQAYLQCNKGFRRISRWKRHQTNAWNRKVKHHRIRANDIVKIALVHCEASMNHARWWIIIAVYCPFWNFTKAIHSSNSLLSLQKVHSLHLNCHSACPLAQRILLSKRQAVCTSHFLRASATPFCVSKAILRISGSAAAMKSRFFENVDHQQCPLATTLGLRPIRTFPTAYGSSWRVAYSKLWHWRQLKNIPTQNE